MQMNYTILAVVICSFFQLLDIISCFKILLKMFANVK